VDTFLQFAKSTGKDIRVKLDNELKEDDAKGIDLVISLGGDHTYLRASAMAKTSGVPILGIDTNEAFAHGQLSSNSINFRHSKEIAEKLLKCLDQPDKREFKKRTRILFEAE